MNVNLIIPNLNFEITVSIVNRSPLSILCILYDERKVGHFYLITQTYNLLYLLLKLEYFVGVIHTYIHIDTHTHIYIDLVTLSDKNLRLL